ncbi:MAG: sigma-54-dependent transcriptional regulator, partial [Polyangiaceae bacterium]
MKDAKTISVAAGDGRSASSAAAPDGWALVVAWCAEEPHRTGEVALFPARGAAQILGRGEGDEDEVARVRFFRQRPGQLVPTPALSAPALSRRQLSIRPRGRGLEVERLGRCELSVNGAAVDTGIVGDGETVMIGGQLLLLCTRRAPAMKEALHFRMSGAPAFGEADSLSIVGESPLAWQLRDDLAFAASAGKHVLVQGESGTGKELAARAVHRLSPRASGPFVARNAATLPPALIDAELFGNAKNYPNHGMAERPGLVGQADGGTLFLDELAELPAEQQAHLLRVLDAGGEHQRLGDATTRRSDFLLVAATNRPPASIKHDLLARLTLRIQVPRLDARREDIPLLVRALLLHAAEKSPAAAAR